MDAALQRMEATGQALLQLHGVHALILQAEPDGLVRELILRRRPSLSSPAAFAVRCACSCISIADIAKNPSFSVFLDFSLDFSLGGSSNQDAVHSAEAA